MCLNGKKLKLDDAAEDRVISVPANATLNIRDCCAYGKQPIVHTDVFDAVTGSGTVSITGGVITGGKLSSSTDKGAAIQIANNGTVNLYGGSISGNSSNGGGGAIDINSGASFTMYGGCISYNRQYNSTYSRYGGGAICSSQSYNIYGGEITHNKGVAGGALYTSSGYVGFYGGDIHDNEGSYGTALYGTMKMYSVNGSCPIIRNHTGNTIYGKGSIVIDGGKICDCSGVAVRNEQGLNMSGGEITNCATAIYSHNNGSVELSGGYIHDNNIGYDGRMLNGLFKLSGNPKIVNNTKNSILKSGNKFTVVGKLLSDASIGVTLGSNSGTFTDGYSTYNNEAPSTFFSSDNNNYTVTLVDGEAALISI